MKIKFTIILIIIIIWAYFFLVNSKINYVDSYFELVGLKERGILVKGENEVINEIGIPIKRYKLNEKFYILVYPNFNIWMGASYKSFKRIVITTDSIKFGIFKIGIGDSEFMLKLAYFFRPKLIDLKEDKIGYIDSYTNVIFTIGDNGKVNRIEISVTDNYD